MSTFTHTKSREQWRHVYIYGWNCNSVRGGGERTDWRSKQESTELQLCFFAAIWRWQSQNAVTGMQGAPLPFCGPMIDKRLPMTAGSRDSSMINLQQCPSWDEVNHRVMGGGGRPTCLYHVQEHLKIIWKLFQGAQKPFWDNTQCVHIAVIKAKDLVWNCWSLHNYLCCFCHGNIFRMENYQIQTLNCAKVFIIC